MWGGFDGMWGRAGISFLKPGTTMNMERYMATQESTFKVSFLKQVTLDLTLLDGRFHAIVEKYSHLITSIPWSSRKAVVIRALWQGAESCKRWVQPLPWKNSSR